MMKIKFSRQGHEFLQHIKINRAHNIPPTALCGMKTIFSPDLGYDLDALEVCDLDDLAESVEAQKWTVCNTCFDLLKELESTND